MALPFPCRHILGEGFRIFRLDACFSCYDNLDWQIKWQEEGDSLARYLVRIDEMKESINIIQQYLALKLLPGGPRGPGNRSMRLGCEIASFQLDRGIVS